MRGLGCCCHPLRGGLDRVDRLIVAPAVVLDRGAGKTGGKRQANRLGNPIRILAEAVLEVGRDRKLGRLDDRRGVGKRALAAE
jgi:hypothetical protein